MGEIKAKGWQKMTEHVEVTLKLPKRLVDFLKDKEEITDMTVKEYLERAIIQSVGADLDEGDTFVPQPEEIIKKYGLKGILKDTVVGL